MSKKISPKVSVYDKTPRKPLEPVEIEPSDGFKEAVFAELQRLEQAKHDAHREPHHTMYIEFQKQVSKALNALYKDGRIQVGQCLNDKYILVNRTEATENE